MAAHVGSLDWVAPSLIGVAGKAHALHIVDGGFAPLWAKLATTLFSNGERLCGAARVQSEVRSHLVSRYIATPSGLPTARALIDRRALVGN